jgi:hypothetical protein
LFLALKNEAVAIDFLTTSGAYINGPKVKVIMKINRFDL